MIDKPFILSWAALKAFIAAILLALSMPAQGWKSSAVLVVVALSLLIPWNVVGTIWQIYGRADIGLMGRLLQ